MTVGSLFSGIGGIDLGLERAGMKVVWQVENNEFCRKALRKHWPGVKLYGDIRELQGNELDPADLICGGFPCQDLSVAGKRAGLAGERSGLFYEFTRIIDGLAPRWVLIENVPGLLSSNGGRDMGAVLGTLAEFGYGYAYRVLDAQYFGVAQQRRRVFIVGCFGDATSAAKVLFEPESCAGGAPQNKATGRVFSTLLASRAGTSCVGGMRGETGYLIWDRAKNAVRRPTPVECERLQGFPDGWTAIDGENTPDSPRYKAIGNAVCVNVAEWIGRAILKEARCE